MTTSDIIDILSTLALVSIALVAPYLVERWKHYFFSPKLVANFIHSQPFCHHTRMRNNAESFPVYYIRFMITNIGRTQAEECEAVLEGISRLDDFGILNKIEDFSPIPLKWSGTSRDRFISIQPDRKLFCDIGRIHDPKFEPDSSYKDISSAEKTLNKIFFELSIPRPYAQWDCLLPGTYELEVSIYSKNAKSVPLKFHVNWSGNWMYNEASMKGQLDISLFKK